MFIAERISVRLYSHQVRMYIRMWWVTLRNVTQKVVTYYRYRPYVRHTVRHIQIYSTQIDGRTTAFFGDGDGGWGRRRGGAIVAWILLTQKNPASPRPTTNITRAMCTSHEHLHLHPHMTCAHSLHTGTRQSCTCVFLVNQ